MSCSRVGSAGKRLVRFFFSTKCIGERFGGHSVIEIRFDRATNQARIMAHLRWSKVLRQVDRLYAKGTSTGCSDSQLLTQFAGARDESELAFEAIVQRHGPMVLEVCRRLLRGDRHAAEDAFQATFLVLARRAGSIRAATEWLLGPLAA